MFVFFGLVAVMGTAYAQTNALSGLSVAAAVPVGMLACALLVVNNLRDAPRDALVGKKTLAVVLGDGRTRTLFAGLLLLPFAVAAAMATVTPWTLLALGALPLALRAVRTVLGGASGRELIPVLQNTGKAQLIYGLLLAGSFLP